MPTFPEWPLWDHCARTGAKGHPNFRGPNMRVIVPKFNLSIRNYYIGTWPVYSTHRECYEDPHYAVVFIIPPTPKCFPRPASVCCSLNVGHQGSYRSSPRIKIVTVRCMRPLLRRLGPQPLAEKAGQTGAIRRQNVTKHILP